MAQEIISLSDELATEMPGMVIYTTKGPYTMNGNTTEFISVAAPAGFGLLGLMVEAQTTYTSTAAQSIVSGATTFTGAVQYYEVDDTQAGGTARINLQTLNEVQELERLVLAPQNVGTNTFFNQFAYPRPTVSGFGSATTRTDYCPFVVPCAGGTAVSIRFKVPNITSIFTSNVTGTVTYVIYAIPTLGNYRLSAYGVQTASLGAGTVDISQYIPAGIYGSYLDFIGVIPSTAGVSLTQVTATGENNGFTCDFRDFTSLLAANTVFPNSPVAVTSPLNGSTPGNGSTVVALHNQRATRLQINLNAAASSGVDLLWIDVNAPSVSPAASPATTPTTPLINATATQTIGGGPVIPSKGGPKPILPKVGTIPGIR